MPWPRLLRFRQGCGTRGGSRFQLYQSEQSSAGDPAIATRRKTLATRLSRAVAARVLPTDYRTNQRSDRIFAEGRNLDSSYGPVWEHLGVAYKKQGRNRGAVSALETATRLLPSSRIAWQHLAQAYQATGRNSDVRRAAARAQQLGGAAPNVAKKKA